MIVLPIVAMVFRGPCDVGSTKTIQYVIIHSVSTHFVFLLPSGMRIRMRFRRLWKAALGPLRPRRHCLHIRLRALPPGTPR